MVSVAVHVVRVAKQHDPRRSPCSLLMAAVQVPSDEEADPPPPSEIDTIIAAVKRLVHGKTSERV